MKKLRFGLPDKPDTGDTFLITPLFKNNDNFILELNDSVRGREIADIFKGMTEIEFVEQVMPEYYYFEKFGVNQSSPFIHGCKRYLEIFGIKTNDYIPYIKLTDEDKEFAKNFLKDFKSPITISPIAGGYENNNDFFALEKMLSIDDWNFITEKLSPNHDILFFSKSGLKSNNFNIKNTIKIFDMDIRKMCSIFNYCKLHIGIENGLLHAALASGSKTISFVEGFGWNTGWLFANYGYTKDMWINETCRSFYLLKSDFKSFEKFL
jgi:hypothetical protein